MTRPFAIPAMPNVHSHAFQRDLRGSGERSEPEADFWSWREEMYRLAAALDPDSMREVAGRVYAEMAAAGYGAVGEFHYVHHRPDGTPYEEPNAMALALAEAAAAAGLRIVLLPAAYHRGGHARFRDATGRRLPRAGRRAAARRPRDRRRRPQRPRRAGGLAARDRRATPTRTGSSATSTRTSSRASWRSAGPSTAARRSSCCTGPASSPTARRSSTASTSTTRDVALLAESRRDRGHVPDDRGQPRRRPLPGAAATATPACGWRSAATATSSSTRSRSCASSRPARGASGRTRHALLAAAGDLWGAVCRERPRARSGSTTPARWRSTSTTRGCAACPTRTSCARWRPARVGRYGRARAAPDLVRLDLRAADRLLARGRRRRLGPRLRHHRVRLRDDDDLRRRGRAGRAGAGQRRRRPGRGRLHVRRRRPRPLPAPATPPTSRPCWPALRRCFGEVRPAATMQECGLTDPRMRFEIEVTARRQGR